MATEADSIKGRNKLSHTRGRVKWRWEVVGCAVIENTDPSSPADPSIATPARFHFVCSAPVYCGKDGVYHWCIDRAAYTQQSAHDTPGVHD